MSRLGLVAGNPEYTTARVHQYASRKNHSPSHRGNAQRCKPPTRLNAKCPTSPSARDSGMLASAYQKPAPAVQPRSPSRSPFWGSPFVTA